MERLGRRHQQQPVSASGDGRIDARPGAPVATEMGVWISRRSSANAQPTIVGGLLFVGGGDRKVYALDAKSGCIRWTFATEAVVRTAISFGPISGTDSLRCFLAMCVPLPTP